MTAKLQEKLLKKYPEFFEYLKTYDGPLMPICFGFECDDGWYNILDDLMGKLKEYCKERKEYIDVHQIKEKFGGLCFYIGSGDDKIFNMIHDAESLSYQTCEICGSTENVGQTCGWIKTICHKCSSKEDKYKLTWTPNKK
jgi:hypothetical protein